MILPEETGVRLADLLGQTTVLVSDERRPVGAAFFISGDRLLTCWHVVKDIPEDRLKVTRVGGTTLGAKVVWPREEADRGDLDIALLSVHQADPNEWQPCVALFDRLRRGRHTIAGFPRLDPQVVLRDLAEAGQEVYEVSCHPRRDLAGTDEAMLIEAGSAVTFGMSGGPVLDRTTGAVVAVVRASKAVTGHEGGEAIPVERVAAACPEVAQLLNTPSAAVRGWRDLLGPGPWQELGKPSNIDARVELRLSGGRRIWQIGVIGSPDQPHDMSGSALGVEIAEALFYWAQQRRVRAAQEVRVLGRLLSRALLPAPVINHLTKFRGCDTVAVRLHVDSGPTDSDPEGRETGEKRDLAAVPWELVAIDWDNPKNPTFIAADGGFRFVRVLDSPGPALVPAVSPDKVNVLAVLVQPDEWEHTEVASDNSDGIKWPDSNQISQRLSAALRDRGFSYELQTDPLGGEAETELRSGRYQVLHYAGTGRVWNGEAQIAFYNPDEGGESWASLAELLEVAVDNGVRVFVLEFMFPRVGKEYEPITPKTIADIIEPRSGPFGHPPVPNVSALVCTNEPVHPNQFRMFNDTFYRALAEGRSVETAVQEGRVTVKRGVPASDAAGFAWFTVFTGHQSDVRLVLEPADRGEAGREPGSSRSRPVSQDPAARHDK